MRSSSLKEFRVATLTTNNSEKKTDIPIPKQEIASVPGSSSTHDVLRETTYVQDDPARSGGDQAATPTIGIDIQTLRTRILTDMVPVCIQMIHQQLEERFA